MAHNGDTQRIGVIGIVVESLNAASRINSVLHRHSELIVGRMGIPYRERGISIMSVVVDGTPEAINALTGSLGRIPNTSAKAVFSKERWD